jgi:hypothetical protein
MATTLAPAINITNVSKGMNSLNAGLGNLKKSSDTIKTVTLNRTKIKRESFARDKIVANMREEAIRRKDQESIIEASGIGGAMRRSATVIGDSTKGFLGRILDFASSLLIGWLLFNLPTIMTAIQDLITRITSLTQLLRDFISNITNTFENFGNLLSGVYQNVTQFDFTDQSKKVQSAMDDLNVNLETMRDQFMQGFDMLSKPLGEGPGEEPVPELNTDYTQDGPTTGEGYATAGLSGASKKIIGNDTAFLGEVKRVSQKYEIKEGDLLGLLASESRFDPAAGQIGDHVGLIQFGVSEARSVGTTQDALKKMSRAEQMKYVDKYFETRKLKKGAGAGQLYATVFAPAYASGDPNRVLYSSPSREYASNAPLDSNRDGKITVAEMGGRIQQKKKEFGISDNVSIIPTGKTTQISPTPTGTSASSTALAQSAERLKQQRLDTSRYGRDGCVYAVNEVYRAAGMTPPWGTEVYVPTARSILVKKGWSQVGVKNAKPGDIVIMSDRHPTKPWVHIGIVSTKGTVIHNSSTNRALTNEESFSSLVSRYVRIEVFRDPAVGSMPAAQITSSPSKALPAQILNKSQVSPPEQVLPPAQVSSTTSPGQNVPSVAQNRRGQQIIIADNPQQPQPQQVSAGGGGSQPQMIPTESSLNSLIKNQILLELAYT